MFKQTISYIRLLVAALLFLSTPFLLAQDRGAVSGRVTDPAGATTKDAQVTITNEETGVALEAKTNDAGEYTFSTLNAGRYSVAIMATGFEKILQQHIQVDV